MDNIKKCSNCNNDLDNCIRGTQKRYYLIGNTLKTFIYCKNCLNLFAKLMDEQKGIIIETKEKDQ